MKYNFALIMIPVFTGCSGNPDNNSAKVSQQHTSYMDGEKVFKAHCAMCHRPDADMTGPALRNSFAHLGSKGTAVSFLQNSQPFLKEKYILSLKKICK